MPTARPIIVIMFVDEERQLERLTDERGQRQRRRRSRRPRARCGSSAETSAPNTTAGDQRDRDADRLAGLRGRSRRPSGSRGRSTPGRRTCRAPVRGGGLRGGDDVPISLSACTRSSRRTTWTSELMRRRAGLGGLPRGILWTAAITAACAAGEAGWITTVSTIRSALPWRRSMPVAARFDSGFETKVCSVVSALESSVATIAIDTTSARPRRRRAPGWAAERRAQRAGERRVVMVGLLSTDWLVGFTGEREVSAGGRRRGTRGRCRCPCTWRDRRRGGLIRSRRRRTT